MVSTRNIPIDSQVERSTYPDTAERMLLRLRRDDLETFVPTSKHQPCNVQNKLPPVSIAETLKRKHVSQCISTGGRETLDEHIRDLHDFEAGSAQLPLQAKFHNKTSFASMLPLGIPLSQPPQLATMSNEIGRASCRERV